MSAYGKPAPVHLHGFDSSRSFSEPGFSYAAAPPFASQPPAASSNSSQYQNATQLTHMTYSGVGRTQYDDQAGPYLNVGSTPIPQITSYQPSRGTTSTPIYVLISSLYELLSANVPTFYLMFGSRKCPASISRLDQPGGVCQYQVSASVPEFSLTGWSASEVPIFMLMEGGDGEVMCKVDVGPFNYVDEGSQGSSAGSARERKISADAAETKSPIKRSASGGQLRTKEEFAAYAYSSAETPQYTPYLQPTSSYGMIPQYNRPAQYQPQVPARNMYPYANSSTSSPPLHKAQSPQVTSWTPYGSQSSRSPGLPISSHSARPALSALPSPLAANPPLVRTSILQTPSPATTPSGAQSFNPYPPYSAKAQLKIMGDLDLLIDSWTLEEWESKRRIVMFKRSQSGSTITTTFKPVAVDARPPNSTCISCIWWEERKECFVTSVDTIYLLEQLVAAKFTVEEKNRIRRNLEGFRPLTVSKAKAESEEFFKLIMGFPNPKPRNIEKDVKVFPWKILQQALRKIISKYSASPSSTLPPALLTPVSSTGYVTESSASHPQSLCHPNSHDPLSPRSISRSISGTSISTYTTSAPISSRALSPPMKLHHSAVPSQNYGPPTHLNDTHGWHNAQQHHMPSNNYPQLGSNNPSASTSQNARPTWEMNSYLDPSPAGGSSMNVGAHSNTNINAVHANANAGTVGSSNGLPSMSMSYGGERAENHREGVHVHGREGGGA